MSNQIRLFTLAGILAVSTFTATGAQAAGWIVGLVGGNTLVTIDPATRKVATKVDIKGANGSVAGFDVRPADGMLYVITSDGTIGTIDLKSGLITKKSKLSQPWKAGTTTIDFNPVADRLRVMSSEGVNARVNVDDGQVTVDGGHKFKDGDVNAGKKPKVIAGAYSNSKKGTTATALYNVDATTGSLVTQAPPNDGVLNTVGPLGIALNEPVAFNIVAEGEGNKAWLTTGGNLYSVALDSGKATMVGKIEGLTGRLKDIAWVD